MENKIERAKINTTNRDHTFIKTCAAVSAIGAGSVFVAEGLANGLWLSGIGVAIAATGIAWIINKIQ